MCNLDTYSECNTIYYHDKGLLYIALIKPLITDIHVHVYIYTLCKKGGHTYLHAIGELIDDILGALLPFGSGKHHVASVKHHHHLMDMLLGLGGIDKE